MTTSTPVHPVTKETLKPETVEHIEEIIDNSLIDDFDWDKALDFIDRYGEHKVEYIEDYWQAIDDIYTTEGSEKEAVDLWCEDNYVENVDSCAEAYYGYYEDIEDFVQEYLDSSGDEIPSWVCIDYQRTWDSGLGYDFNEIEFNGGVHIWRNF